MIGISNGFARIGGALAPIISDKISFFILLYAGLGLVGFVLTFFIHETLGKQMVDEIEDRDIDGK